jgi:hypothetical protein
MPWWFCPLYVILSYPQKPPFYEVGLSVLRLTRMSRYFKYVWGQCSQRSITMDGVDISSTSILTRRFRLSSSISWASSLVCSHICLPLSVDLWPKLQELPITASFPNPKRYCSLPLRRHGSNVGPHVVHHPDDLAFWHDKVSSLGPLVHLLELVRRQRPHCHHRAVWERQFAMDPKEISDCWPPDIQTVGDILYAV